MKILVAGAACDVVPKLFSRGRAEEPKSLYPSGPLVFPHLAPQTRQHPEFYPTPPLHGVSIALYARPLRPKGGTGG